MINQKINEAISFAKSLSFALPPFAYWNPEVWRSKGSECNEIRCCMLGWDLTDFGSGDFDSIGLTLFTIRNGSATNPHYSKPYCEKLLVVQDGQVCPYHYHWKKTEDIINRGGSDLMIQLYNSADDGGFSDAPIYVSVDGTAREIAAGSIIRLTPGESVTLTPGMYHQFWAEGGRTLVGEVSMVNDDSADNRFHEPRGRFPQIVEDEPPAHLLCGEYPAPHA